MRFVVQVVSKSDVKIDGEIKGSIGKGFMVLVGVGQEDNEAIADRMVNKLLGLRIFPDENGKTNLSLADVNWGTPYDLAVYTVCGLQKG